MATIGNSADLSFEIGGVPIQGIPQWRDITLSAVFGNTDAQPSITSDTFELTNEAYLAALNHIAAGNIFEGLQFLIRAQNNARELTVFNGFLDFRENRVDSENRRFECRILQKDALTTLSERASALTFGSLRAQGIITDGDFVEVPYLVEEPFDPLRVATTSVTLYLIVKDIQDSIYSLAEAVATISGITSSSETGGIGAAIYAGLQAAARIAAFAAKLVALVRLADQLLALLYPIQRTHQAATLRTLMARAMQALGYTLQSNIPELDTYVYLASNTTLDKADISTGFLTQPGEITVGIPNIGDYGYRVNEFFDLCRRLFNASYYIDGNTVIFAWDEDPLIKRLSTFRLPDIQPTAYSYNTDELAANFLISFQVDQSDIWTLEDYTGVSYEVRTTAEGIANPRANLLRGQRDERFEVALGSRKSSLSPVENVLRGVFQVIDQLSGIFGGGTNLSNQVTERIDVLRVSQNNTSRPKLLVLENGRIPADHRQKLSAKYLYDRYHFSNSFVLSDGIGQKIVYEGVQVPFGLEDFVKVVGNSWAKDAQGREIKITALEWQIGADKATVSYWRRQRYTDKLRETYIQP